MSKTRKNCVVLKCVYDTEIKPEPPFHFEGTFCKPSHFPSPTECYENQTFWFPMRLDTEIHGIRVHPHPKRKSVLNMTIFSKNTLDDSAIKSIVSEVKYRFDMDANLHGFIEMAKQEPKLKAIAKKWRGMRVSCAFSLYELLCITIVLQNAQVNRSVKMLSNLLSKYGKKICFDNQELFSFWTPKELLKVTEEDLRELKVGYRAKSFLRVSSFFAEKASFEQQLRTLSKPEASKQLRCIYGVGPATCGYLLFEKLHHYNALDHISPWETQILGKLIFGRQDVSSDDLLEYANDKWGEWRMLAVHYLFEDIFWQRQRGTVEWLSDFIRL